MALTYMISVRLILIPSISTCSDRPSQYETLARQIQHFSYKALSYHNCSCWNKGKWFLLSKKCLESWLAQHAMSPAVLKVPAGQRIGRFLITEWNIFSPRNQEPDLDTSWREPTMASKKLIGTKKGKPTWPHNGLKRSQKNFIRKNMWPLSLDTLGSASTSWSMVDRGLLDQTIGLSEKPRMYYTQ